MTGRLTARDSSLVATIRVCDGDPLDIPVSLPLRPLSRLAAPSSGVAHVEDRRLSVRFNDCGLAAQRIGFHFLPGRGSRNLFG